MINDQIIENVGISNIRSIKDYILYETEILNLMSKYKLSLYNLQVAINESKSIASVLQDLPVTKDIVNKILAANNK